MIFAQVTLHFFKIIYSKHAREAMGQYMGVVAWVREGWAGVIMGQAEGGDGRRDLGGGGGRGSGGGTGG